MQGLKQKKNPEPDFFFGDGPGRGGAGGWWAAHAKHAMTVETFERILWHSYFFPYSN